MNNLKYYIPGIFLVLMGTLIIIIPQILVAFVAAFVFLGGISLLYAGHLMRKTEAGWRDALRTESYVRVFRTPFEEHYSYWH